MLRLQRGRVCACARVHARVREDGGGRGGKWCQVSRDEVVPRWSRYSVRAASQEARRVIREMTRVSYDETPFPPLSLPTPPPHLCQGMNPPHPRWQPPLRHFPLLIFIYTSLPASFHLLSSSSSFLPLFPPQYFFIFYMSVRGASNSCAAALGLPPHAPGPRRGRSKKEGGRTLSVVNFNFGAHCRYSGAPLNPSLLLLLPPPLRLKLTAPPRPPACE